MNKFFGKTVMVTGATGLLGSHIVDKLMKFEGVNVIALSRSKEKMEKCFSQYLQKDNFTYIAQDVAQEIRVASTVDYIFHAASPMEGKVIRETPVNVITPNLLGTTNCLNFLREQKEKNGVKGRLILFSSVTVYGKITNEECVAIETDTRITENLDSVSAPYSQSKRMSEVIALAYMRQYDIDVVIARFSTVYGATYFIPDTAFFEFLRKGLKGETIVLNEPGMPKRDNIYIDDAVSGVLLVATDGVSGESYNISSNGDMDNYAAVDEIAQVILDIIHEEDVEKPVISFKKESNGLRKAGLKLDNTKLKKLGWDIEISLREGIKRTIKECN